MTEIKKIVIKTKDTDYIIHTPIDKAPYTLFSLFLSLGLTPKQARAQTDKTLYNLEHGIKYDKAIKPTN